jgi:thiol:disulfide interchange protein
LVALRNAAILVVLAFGFTFLGDGLALTNRLVSQLIMLALVIGLAIFGIQYFRENQLKWLVIKRPLRGVIIVCGVLMAFLAVAGRAVLGDRLSPGTLLLFEIILGLVIVWIVVDSRRN